MAIQSVSQPIGKIINFRKSPPVEVENWVSIGSGIDSGILCTTNYNGKVYVGTRTGEVYVYSGSSWSISYDSGSNAISAFCVYDGKLYAGGEYHDNIYVFDDSTWSVSRTGTNWGGVYIMAVYDGNLYAGTNDAGTIYVFNGTSWSVSVVTGSSNHKVYSMAVFNSKLYAGTSYRLWVKDGISTWAVVEEGYWYYNLIVYDGKMYCGKDGSIQYYNGSSWTYCIASQAIYGSYIYAYKLYMSENSNGVVHVLSDGAWSQFVMEAGVMNYSMFTTMGGTMYAGTWNGSVFSMTLIAGTFQSISQPIGDIIRLRRNENNVPKETTGNTVSQPIGHTGIRLRRNFSNVPGE
jgi:hypothetical protein